MVVVVTIPSIGFVVAVMSFVVVVDAVVSFAVGFVFCAVVWIIFSVSIVKQIFKFMYWGII